MKTNTLKRVSFGSMAVIMLILVVATIIEKFHGTSFAISNIYHSWYFIALWSLLAVSAMVYIIRVSRRKTLLLLHLSFVIIMLGAIVSFMTSERGEIVLQKDSVPASMFTTQDGKLEKLPFRLQLHHIDISYIKEEVDDYIAEIIISDRGGNAKRVNASLNNPIRREGYSFCIKDMDEEGVSLLVSYDPWGVAISYTGYLMTIISFMMLFFDRKSGVSTLLAKKRYRITYKSILITVTAITLVLFRINAFSGNSSQPILRTPLLAAHVSTIIIAYTLIGSAAINSLLALLDMSNATKMKNSERNGRLLLYPATMLLATGIFIGALWANISWGRYWGWDPKEVWALATLLVCSFTFHTHSLPFMAKPLFFHIYCIAIFIVMLFTYFGVNYLLSGLHSYV